MRILTLHQLLSEPPGTIFCSRAIHAPHIANGLYRKGDNFISQDGTDTTVGFFKVELLPQATNGLDAHGQPAPPVFQDATYWPVSAANQNEAETVFVLDAADVQTLIGRLIGDGEAFGGGLEGKRPHDHKATA